MLLNYASSTPQTESQGEWSAPWPPATSFNPKDGPEPGPCFGSGRNRLAWASIGNGSAGRRASGETKMGPSYRNRETWGRLTMYPSRELPTGTPFYISPAGDEPGSIPLGRKGNGRAIPIVGVAAAIATTRLGCNNTPPRAKRRIRDTWADYARKHPKNWLAGPLTLVGPRITMTGVHRPAPCPISGFPGKQGATQGAARRLRRACNKFQSLV